MSGRQWASPRSKQALLGRAAESAAVRRALVAGRLVTMVGTGGVGKTALAMAAIGDLRRTFADGVHMVDLGDVEPGSDVRTVAAAVRRLPRLYHPGQPAREEAECRN